jgi:hypothetical protein
MIPPLNKAVDSFGQDPGKNAVAQAPSAAVGEVISSEAERRSSFSRPGSGTGAESRRYSRDKIPELQYQRSRSEHVPINGEHGPAVSARGEHKDPSPRRDPSKSIPEDTGRPAPNLKSPTAPRSARGSFPSLSTPKSSRKIEIDAKDVRLFVSNNCSVFYFSSLS